MRVATITRILICSALFVSLTVSFLRAEEPLASWNDTAAKEAIIKFVAAVTDENSPDYVPPEDRIATFDNDGTLWTEHPMYTQLAFAIDRVKALAPQNPQWKSKQPFQAVLENNPNALAASGEEGLVELVTVTHSGVTTEEFANIVTDWFATARHPRFKRPYTQCNYLPMLELLEYLRANGFTTYIVSGGGVEFMRTMTMNVYGIPSQQVVGTTIKTEFEMRDGKPVLVRMPAIDFIDDKKGKPIGINKFIGKRPIAAFGNSAGDREMLEWIAGGDGLSLKMLVFHDDEKREYAYGPANGLPNSPFGTFPQDLMDQAKEQGWVVISMKDDWKEIFAPVDKQPQPFEMKEP